MTARSLKLLSAGIICIAVASITIASCDNNSTNPGNPSGTATNTGGRGKGPQVLRNGFGTLAVDRGSFGTVSLERSEEDPTVLVASKFSTEGRSGLTSAFAPAAAWSQDADVTFPKTGGFLTYTILDDSSLQSTLRVGRGQGGDVLSYLPGFTGGPPDSTSYDLTIFANNVPVVHIPNIPPVRPVEVRESTCCRLLRGLHFFVLPDGRCRWQLAVNECCSVRISYNGVEYLGDRVQLTERNTDGQYPYHSFNRVAVNGFVQSYTIASELAVQ